MKPILFNTEMVKAILDGRKTQTRRVIKPQPNLGTVRWDGERWTMFMGYPLGHDVPIDQYGDVGDILYVRERFREFCGMFYSWNNGCYIPAFDFEGIEYFADGQMKRTDPGNLGEMFVTSEDVKTDISYGKWRPSIHMPKKAARIFLKITDVRIERLQDITCEDIYAEGAPFKPRGADWYNFEAFWDSLYAKRGYGWDSNPWVWVISFERIDKPEEEL